MSDASTSFGELEMLSGIIKQISPSSGFIEQMGQFTALIGRVVPFTRCVILHERDGRVVSGGFGYRDRTEREGRDGLPGPSYCGAAIGIEQYLAGLDCHDRMDHSFRWRDSGRGPAGGSDPLLSYRSHMQGRQGVAACVRSTVGGTDEVVTLMQFACTEVSAREALFISFIAYYMHSTFALQAMEPGLQDEFFGIKLTGKERDVLKWVVEGKTSWEIGKILSTSERTVKFHLKNVYAKLNVSNRAHAVAMVNRLNLI